MRLAAASALTDQELLKQLVLKSKDVAALLAAIPRIADEQFLLSLRGSVGSSLTQRTVSRSAVKALHTQETLAKVAMEADLDSDREAARTLLKDETLREAVKRREEAHALETKAVREENDLEVLKRTALNGGYDFLRRAAAARLEDQTAIGNVACQTEDVTVGRILFAKLEDENVLKRVAGEAKSKAVRQAALIKIRKATWKGVFQEAASTGTLPGTEDIAEATAFILESPQKSDQTDMFAREIEISDAIWEFCAYLIRKGDEKHIPDLWMMLVEHGTKALALMYINCGQPDLEDMATDWASEHRLSVESTGLYGVPRVVWPSGNR